MKDEKIGKRIYIADVSCLEDGGLFERLMGLVSGERREKVQGCRLDKDKRLSLGAGVLLTEGLKRLGLDRAGVRIGRGVHGKPFLEGTGTPLFFNLSHSGARVMAAFAGEEIGCDVERIREMNESVAERFYARPERELLAKEPDEEKRRRLFYRIWTKKESYIKATGEGMRLALDGFSVIGARGWHFAEYDLRDGYCYACCSRKAGFPETPEILDLRWIE